jgi:hypothetical protein
LEALSWCFPTATNCRGASAVSWWRGQQWLACMSASDVVVASSSQAGAPVAPWWRD